MTQIITDLGLWLAVHEPHCCALSESVAGQRLSAAPLAIQDTKFTAGVRGTDGIAVLSSAEGRLSARGHGPAGERLAGRAGVSRSTCIPLSGVMLDERHHWFVLSWPTVTR